MVKGEGLGGSGRRIVKGEKDGIGNERPETLTRIKRSHVRATAYSLLDAAFDRNGGVSAGPLLTTTLGAQEPVAHRVAAPRRAMTYRRLSDGRRGETASAGLVEWLADGITA
jgi:hypothetical protein